MSVDHSYDDHVWMFEDMDSRPSEVWDVVLGTFCLVVGLFGFLGNSIALGYFFGKTDLASRLYKRICCIDILICVCQTPMIYSLLNKRLPGLFDDEILCSIFASAYLSFTRMYAIVVLFLCTSRTIAILRPFYRIKKRLVIATFYVSITLLALQEVMFYFLGFVGVYGADCGYCYPHYDLYSTGKLSEGQSVIITVKYLLQSIELGVPLLINVGSFVLVIRKLMSRSSHSVRGEGRNERQDQKAAATIAIFTGVFLLFYTPAFFVQMSYTLTTLNFTENFVPDPGMFSSYFMFWYVWPLCEGLDVVNATCDFLVYLARMKNFQAWLGQKRQAVTDILCRPSADNDQSRNSCSHI